MADFKFEIEKKIAPLTEPNYKGRRLELNFVSFNDRKPKYDIREWDENHESMGKGVTLDREALKKLGEAIQKELQD